MPKLGARFHFIVVILCADHSSQERLLESELALANRVWQIAAEDLKFVRRIDGGAFGEVCLHCCNRI